MQRQIFLARSLRFPSSLRFSSPFGGLPLHRSAHLERSLSPFHPWLASPSGKMSADTRMISRLIVLSGPSGVGKSTIKDRLMSEYPDKFEFSVSHTTRAPRRKANVSDALEQDGEDYWFVPMERFDAMVANDEFVEHAVFGRNKYGTSKAAIEKIADAGRVCLLDIEMEGVKQIRNSTLPARFLFVAPPSVEVLEGRLRGRATDDEDSIQRRLDQAKREIEYANSDAVHDKIVVNDDLETAYREVRDFCLQGF
ncbi:guanylate kinase [Eremomyces bilateralis CBS 781.70]|uniref:Guanylate kinase n=1 Tax=Eremomyces bilateralis CBS 781.70 TaxID=1392243 RepID=A0A6G1G980_9PEZI|nr:guanylate kinase [Eremomyces bilateralis CBS 781.70]KAF1814594.1 guanylate kinase [Eremomyces bilateralis CBS 781.70]